MFEFEASKGITTIRINRFLMHSSKLINTIVSFHDSMTFGIIKRLMLNKNQRPI